MLVLEKLTSRKGAKIEVHFEDEKLREFWENNFLHGRFQREMRDQIDLLDMDTGKGTVVHLLVNDQKVVQFMGEAEYAEWQAEEKKDWFHLPTDPLEILGGVLALAAIDLLEISRGYEFVGPTKKEFDDLFSDPINLDKFRLLNCLYDCKLCPALTENCPERKASFDYEALKKFLQQNYVESKAGVLH